MRKTQIKKGKHYFAKVFGSERRVIVIDDTPRHPMAWKSRILRPDGNVEGPDLLLVSNHRIKSKDFIEEAK